MSTSGASGSVRLRLSRPEPAYSIVSETNRNFALEQADRANFKKFEEKQKLINTLKNLGGNNE